MTSKKATSAAPQVLSPTHKFELLRAALRERYLERAELIDGALVAMLSGEPLIMIGPPGTAKSAIARSICESLHGKFFGWMLTKFTVPEELFGPFSLKGLENDQYVRVTTGKLPEADIVFLDEVGKASSSISNTLLPILNSKERIFYNNGQAVKVPTLAIFGSSNEVPQSEDLSAFYDRWTLRFNVNYVEDETSIRRLFNPPTQYSPIVPITRQELEAARKDSCALALGTGTEDALVAILREVRNEGFMVSDRKWVQMNEVIRANAYLNAHIVVEVEDLSILTAVLWSTPDQIAKVQKIVGKICNPLGEKILNITDGIRDVYRELQKNKGKENDGGIEAFNKARNAVKKLEELGNPAQNAKLLQAITWAKSIQLEIGDKHLGLKI